MEVARAGDADILRCFDEHVAELEARARVRDAEWPVTAVDLVLAALIAFRPLEVGKHVLVGPAGIAQLAPMVEVLALAADIDQPVDGTRPAEPAAARPGAPAPGQRPDTHPSELQSLM